jgi:hypothetical protein
VQLDRLELKDRQAQQDLLVLLDRLELQARQVRRVALDLLVQAGQMQMLYQEY